MSQTKLGSFAEAWANIFVGLIVNLAANSVILPLFGFAITLRTNLEMGVLYTCISLARSFVLRRWFNSLKFGNAK